MDKSTTQKCAEFALKAGRWVSVTEIMKALGIPRGTCRFAIIRMLDLPKKYRAESKVIRDGMKAVRVLMVKEIIGEPEMTKKREPIPVIGTCEKTGSVVRFRSIRQAHANGYNWGMVKKSADTGSVYAGMKWRLAEAGE